MTQSSIMREYESGDGLPLWLLRFIVLSCGLVFLCFTAVLPLTWPEQAVLAALLLCFTLIVDRSSNSYLVTLTLMLLSVYATCRYAFWRLTTVVGFFRDPGAHWNALDEFFIWLLLLAEGYAFVVLLLGYLQTLWPLRRMPVALPDEVEDWPSVDLLIPTLDEPLSVVRSTVLAAINIDWPEDKLNVCLLDDGRREEFRAFAKEAGVGYITRENNRHAKAGNINHALQQLNSPFVAVFDADHVPTRSFLQMTMGWFLRDRKLAMLQTPHHFYSPDPFERNLHQFHIIPDEDQLFYGVVQDGNDFWNSTLFCGSCAVLRRSALDHVGGMATETVTEDAHTSLRLQMRGWNTAYINIPQAAGLATERLRAHIRQRIRWARGMVQILSIENPLLAPGLKPAQRLCYFNAMSHFLFALPRLIFLTAPLIYLIFGYTNIPGYWAEILAYAVPYLILARIVSSRVQGKHRYSFWNDIYETVLSPYILMPTLRALLSPKRGRFNTTPKGGVIEQDYFDARIARPFLLLLAMNLFGLLCAIPRLLQVRIWNVPPIPGTMGRIGNTIAFTVTGWLASLYDASHPGTISINVAWTFFNVTILGVAAAVAWESQQRRRTVRTARALTADVIFADGTAIHGVTSDISSGGVHARMDHRARANIGDAVRFILPVLDGSAMLPARIVEIDGTSLRARFDSLSLPQEEALTVLLYSRADTWLGWDEERKPDRPLRSFGRILGLSLHGLAQTLRRLFGVRRSPAKRKLATSVVPVLLLMLLAGAGGSKAWAAQAALTASAVGIAKPAAETFDDRFALADLGMNDAITLRGTDASQTVNFSVPRNRQVKSASMRLRLQFSPGLLPQISHLNVSLNGKLIATLPITPPPIPVVAPDEIAPPRYSSKNILSITRVDEQSALLEAALNLPAALVVHDNQLTFEFIGHYTTQCEDPSYSTLWSHVDSDSTIELAGSLLALPNDLNLLPRPFYDAGTTPHPTVPIVFLAQPSAKAIEAAGIIASWFGVLAGDHPVRFPVSIGTIPPGNAIVIGEAAADIPAKLKIGDTIGATLAMRANPVDPYAKVLLVTGDNADDLLKAATALAMQRDLLQGAQMSITNLIKPSPRRPDDAPRWLSTDRNRQATLGELAQAGSQPSDLQSDGAAPISVSMRLPPDLYYGSLRDLALHLSYRYNGIPLADGSTLQMHMNSAYVSSTPMPHTDQASTVLETTVPVPVGDVRPFTNSATLKFDFQPARDAICMASVPLNLQGAVLKDSYLDIAELPHWTTLPNLELFANAGYPFTRMADLADTAVVLPDQPTPEELELFLTMMGHFSAQTGYPALNLTVTDAAGMSGGSGKDYLVMGTVEDQAAFTRLDGAMPVTLDEAGLHIHDTSDLYTRIRDSWWRARLWGPVRERVWSYLQLGPPTQPGQLDTAGAVPDVLIEGIEWPRRSNRSTVVMVLRDPEVVASFLPAFLRASQTSAIAQSVSILRGGQFSSYRMGSDAYHVGALSPLTYTTLLLQEYPALIVLVAVVLAVLMAALFRAMLRRSARARLQGNTV